ncbi:B-cell receptor CD22-like [Arctopsyche grandis]|uniref:B-cell receptor CD22-like n=1 Tax=Arctopsyche grandis TaxID=121162 RepID=UPI00406D72AB
MNSLMTRGVAEAVLGRTATLPCSIEPNIKEDRAYMVLWFRDRVGKPLYIYDVRGRAFNKALYWSDPATFGPRAYFVTVSKPAALTIDSVRLDDEGLYMCRVDFKNSPTRNFEVMLNVIVPPHQLLMYDNSGRDVAGTIGPLEEGSNLVLVCEVRGGRPEPKLTWFINDKASDNQGTRTENHVVVNRLEVPNLTREHLNSTYKCQASNTKLINPQEKTARLELNLKPISVKIQYKPTKLKADTTYTVVCEVLGSRPPAQVTWYRDNRRFRRGKITDVTNETLVVSSLSFAPSPEDDGTRLRCQADNPRLPASPLDDSFTLNVVYPPLVVLSLGSTLNPDDIKEGDDVYFECNIKANPKEHRITWYHDDRQVVQNMTSGVILSTRSLVLQRVARQDAGSYTCRAANARGETSSQPVRLRVQYAPVCSSGEVAVIGAALDEALRVRCSVEADPADVTFVWQFNNSGESFDVSPARYGTSHGASELRYTPASARDYGTLSCRGTNAIGRQAEPCLYQLVPAGKPSPLRNCTLRGAVNTTDALEVRCVAGHDGGLPQTFVLEAVDARTKRRRLNITAPSSSDLAVFRVELSELWPLEGVDSGLGGPGTLNIVLYSKNQKGSSDVVILENIAFNDAERRTDGGSALGSVPVGWALGGAGALVVCVAALALGARASWRRRAHSPSGAPPAKPPAPSTNARPPASLLEINTGEQRYVVAYTLKPTSDRDRQPDILNPRSELEISNDCDDDSGNLRSDSPVLGTQPAARPDALFSARDLAHLDNTRHRPDLPTSFMSPQSTASGGAVGLSGAATLGRPPRRRDHIITNTIPGPESCV